MAAPKQINNNKATRGRQRIQIKKLENESMRQVTFSKRRTGLFKKASELCVLCGAEAGIIVFSPKGKPFCFGHPGIDDVLDRHDLITGTGEEEVLVTDGSIPCWEQFNEVYQEAQKKLVEEKQRSKETEEENEERKNKGEFWWNDPIDNMGLDELQAYVKAMMELKNNAARRANKEVKEEVLVAPAAAIANPGGLGNGFAYKRNGGFGPKSGHGGGYGDRKF